MSFAYRLNPPLAVRWILGGLAVVAVVSWTIWPYWQYSPLETAEGGLATVAFAATGAALYGDRQQRGNAGLFWLVAVLFTAASVGGHNSGPFPLIEYVLDPLPFVPLAAVLLRYPEPCLRRRIERVYLATGALTVLSLRLVEVALSRPEWSGYARSAWWLTVSASPIAWSVAVLSRRVAETLFAALFVPLIVIRVRRAVGIERRMLRPVVVASSAAGLVIALEGLVYFDSAPTLRLAAAALEGGGVLLIPAALLAAAIQRRLSQAVVGDLVRTLSRPATIDLIRASLRDSMADPALEIAYWIPARRGYFDTEGQPFDANSLPDQRMAVPVTASDGRPLAIVIADGSMRRHPGLLSAVLGAAALALENGQLQAEVRTQLAKVRESQSRLVEATDAARRGIARDLHDGAQQRLVVLKMALASDRADARSAAEIARIDRTDREVQRTIKELRELARGVYPSVLTDAGLAAAITSRAREHPLAIEVDVSSERYSPAIETAAYFVICECLTNITKHSGAQHVVITMAREQSDLVLQVTDDGGGGTEIKPGGGLQGLLDRVEAVGGLLDVSSPPGWGTAIIARFPCSGSP